MPPLHLHQLAHLTPQGWQAALCRDWDEQARACLVHWAEHGLPLVVTRQGPAPAGPGVPVAQVSLGLAAPAQWGRRALALQVPPRGIAWFSEFPPLAQALDSLPRRDRPALRALVAALGGHGLRAHVYGSLGWQHLTGLGYLHARSDADLWLAVDSAEQADAAVAALQACASTLRLDGELHLPGGQAVAWREWAAWRAGRCSQVLVKTLRAVALQSDPGLLLSWPLVA